MIASMALVPAAVGLIGPWHSGTASESRIATGFAWICVFVAFVLTCLRFGRGGRTSIDLGPLLERLDRIAAALERSRLQVPTISGAPIDDSAAIVAAIEGSRWSEADAWLADHADHPDVSKLTVRRTDAKAAAAAKVREELAAARDVHDPDRVLELREALSALDSPEALKELDGPLVKWLLTLLMKRMRAGTVRPDVAELARKIAERFPTTIEGASLRASLPTLRRSAGLCPRCVRPYKGIDDACPICLGAILPSEGESDPVAPASDDPPARNWQDDPSLDELDAI